MNKNDPTFFDLATPGVVSASDRSVQTQEVKQILVKRGARYGDFRSHGEIAQQLKAIVYQWDIDKLSPMQREALDMIMHKVARILNGDPNYADSWIDIAGYAQLVVDCLPRVK